jgi:hypothetical protein
MLRSAAPITGTPATSGSDLSGPQEPRDRLETHLRDFNLGRRRVTARPLAMAMSKAARSLADSDKLHSRLNKLKAASARRRQLPPDTPEHTAPLDFEEELRTTIWRSVQSLGHEAE